jgi:flagellar hook-associated protein 3 FlgL
MNNRISTAAIHNQAITRMLSRQSDLAFTQNQMATGKRVNSPSDDPVAATQIMDMQRQKQQLAQYVKNGDAANTRLSMTEQAFADLSNSLNRVRELTLQASSPAMDSTARKAIVSELTTRTQEVQDIGNRRDANGELATLPQLLVPALNKNLVLVYQLVLPLLQMLSWLK